MRNEDELFNPIYDIKVSGSGELVFLPVNEKWAQGLCETHEVALQPFLVYLQTANNTASQQIAQKVYCARKDLVPSYLYFPEFTVDGLSKQPKQALILGVKTFTINNTNETGIQLWVGLAVNE